MFSDGEKIISFAFKIEEKKVASKCKENGNQLNYQIMLPVNYTQRHPPRHQKKSLIKVLKP